MRVFFILALLLPVAFAVNMKPSLEALTELLEAAEQRPAELAEELRNSPMAAIVPTLRPLEEIDTAYEIDPNALPVVVAHGMGDSCFNSGMNSITALIGTHVKAYSVCVPTGDNQMSDTINGFLMNMDKSVDVFAQKIQADANLKNGFNAVGFSQGNALIRGYIHKYNNPPVNVFLSVHGTINGVSSFPQCDPNGLLAGICRPFAQLLGGLAYNSLVQGVLFQAGYFRDPTQYNSQAYLTYSQMAQWNNEGAVTQKYKDNFLKTSKLVMVKALQDHMVFPNEAEWWGSFAPGGFDTIIPMNETRTYNEDLFGLQTAHTSGRLFFETTPGDHLDFTEEQLTAWLDKYF